MFIDEEKQILWVYNESLANKDLANTDFSRTLTRSDEKSCTKNLANTDLANTDIFKIVIEFDENHNNVSFHFINTVTILDFPKEIINIAQSV